MSSYGLPADHHMGVGVNGADGGRADVLSVPWCL